MSNITAGGLLKILSMYVSIFIVSVKHVYYFFTSSSTGLHFARATQKERREASAKI